MSERVVFRNVKRLPIRPGCAQAGEVLPYLTAEVEGRCVPIAVDPELVISGRPVAEVLIGRPAPIPDDLEVVEWPEVYGE
jgi:hypothetical protein